MSWIVEEIRARDGSVSFDEFMELALYHPVHGYYMSATPRFGRDADFLTAPTASEWYSRVVARVLRGPAAVFGPVRVVDVAAGDGSFLAGLFDALDRETEAVVGAVVAVERSVARRQHIAEKVAGPHVECVGEVVEIETVPRVTVVHASELYDAQPVTRVVGRDGAVCELWVVAEGGTLTWSERPAREEVTAYFDGHGVSLEEGQIAEANLAAAATHTAALRAAGDDGLMVTLDYGYESSRLYNPRGRRGGSLATLHRHQTGRDPLQSPGEVDLTAHVNWDDLRSSARLEGWTEIGLWPLAEFLVRAGLADELEERGLGMDAEIDASTYAARQEIKRLLDPEGMGSDLKVLVQAHGRMVDIASKVLAMNSEFGIRNSEFPPTRPPHL